MLAYSLACFFPHAGVFEASCPNWEDTEMTWLIRLDDMRDLLHQALDRIIRVLVGLRRKAEGAGALLKK